MKITENNPKLFQTIGDILSLPPEEMYSYIYGTINGAKLLDAVKLHLGFKNGTLLLESYMVKFSSRRISNALKRGIDWYGLQEYNTTGIYIPSIKCVDVLSEMLLWSYNDKWSRLSKDFKLTYDVLKPLQMESNYDTITDHMETTTNSESGRIKSGNSADNNETEYDNTDNKIYGFNSTDGVNSDSSKNTSKDNSNSTFSSQDSYKGTDTYSRDANSQKTVTRSGNIGNRLPSEMILKEIEFRKNMLKDIIANDINSVLTRSKYI